MTQYDTNPDPARVPPTAPVYTETVETTVVRESNTGWWIAGILGGVVVIAVLWILFARGAQPDADEASLQAQADAAAAQAQADAALVQGQIAGAQASVDIAQADAARAQADAARAASEVRDAQASAPVIIEREVAVPVPTPAPAPAGGAAVVTPTAPQN